MDTKTPAILGFLLVLSLTSIDAWGLTSAQLEVNIRAATTGCPDFTVTNPTTGGLTLYATNYGVSPTNTGAANYADFTTAIAACKSMKANALVVAKGTYLVGDETAGNGHYGSGIFNFDSMTNFVFDGQGSTFLFQNKSMFFYVEYCSKFALQNFTNGWDWTNGYPESLAQVTSVTSSNIDLYYPYETSPITNAPIYEMDEAKLVGTEYQFSHDTSGPVGVSKFDTNAIKLATSELRYTTKSNESGKIIVGQWFIIRHYAYEYKGINTEHSDNVTYSNLVMYSTLGMGFPMAYNKYVQIIDSKLIREPGTIYHLSSAADAVNISGSYGYFKLENDEIGNAGDDSINIHDDTCEGVRSNGVNTLICSNTISFSVGDVVELRNGDYSPLWSSTVTAASSSGGNSTVTFADDLPAGLASDDIVFDHKYNSGNYIISGCNIHNNKGKGAFVHCSNGTIENNYFTNNYNPGLFIASINSVYGSGSVYGEGYNPSNILVLNNNFDGNNIIRNNEITDTYFPNDIVIVGQTGPQAIASYPICQDIIFENNLVDNSTHASMEIGSATNILVDYNKFENPCLTNDFSPLDCIIFTNASSIVFSNNSLTVDTGVKSYSTNIYDHDSATNNVFVFSFSSVTVDAGPPVISEDIEPTYLISYIGNTNTFLITATGSAPFDYQWYQNGLPIVDATNQNHAWAVLEGTNTYYCAVTNNYSAGVPTVSSTATVIGISAPTLNRADFNLQLKIGVNGYNRPETLNNFPVLVELGTNVPGFSYSQFASATGGDLRFTDSSGTSEIPYEINQWNPGGISSVWVQMPTLYGTNDVSATNNVIYAYWGNAADVAAPDYTTNGAVWLWSAPSYEVVYHLEEGGFPYLDSTLQYPATNGIAPVSTNGLIGQCLSFSHTPYLDAGLVNLGNAFTLSAWVNVPSSAYSIQTVWGNGDGVAESAECLFYVDNYDTSDGTLTLTTGDGGATEQKLQSATGAVSFNQWHLVTAVVDRTDGNAQLYVDGNQVASGAAMTDFPTNTDMDLGQDNGGSFQYRGLIDEARIHFGLESSNWVWANWMTVAQNSAFENYSTVSSPIVTLNIQHSGNCVILAWPEGTLQSASVVTGPYSDVPGATSPYTNTASETQQYFRVYVGE